MSHVSCENAHNMLQYTKCYLGWKIGERIMTPEGFLFTFLTIVVAICITVVIVVSGTISSTVAAIADDEDEEE